MTQFSSNLIQCKPPPYCLSTEPMDQILNESGHVHSGFEQLLHHISTDTLLNLYFRMQFTRAFDDKAINLQRQGRLGTFPSARGQEAIASAYGLAMTEMDILAPYYRDQAALLFRNMPPQHLLAYWGGDERGNTHADFSQDFPICVPIASQCPHAAGAAYALKLKAQHAAVVCSLGDGATSKGDFYESLNMASLHILPCLFVVNHNQWAISVPTEKQTASKSISDKALAAGMPARRVDGNDPIAMYLACSDALTHARNGNGPSLIEAITYRAAPHTTADQAQRYETEEQRATALDYDPILRLRTLLRAEGILNIDADQAQHATICTSIEKAAQAYLTTPPQSADSMFQHLYAGEMR